MLNFKTIYEMIDSAYIKWKEKTLTEEEINELAKALYDFESVYMQNQYMLYGETYFIEGEERASVERFAEDIRSGHFRWFDDWLEDEQYELSSRAGYYNDKACELSCHIDEICKENSISAEQIHYELIGTRLLLVIRIENGDWKHTHLLFKDLMKAFNYESMQEDIEETDCDCYTAVYSFRFELSEIGKVKFTDLKPSMYILCNGEPYDILPHVLKVIRVEEYELSKTETNPNGLRVYAYDTSYLNEDGTPKENAIESLIEEEDFISAVTFARFLEEFKRANEVFDK